MVAIEARGVQWQNRSELARHIFSHVPRQECRFFVIEHILIFFGNNQKRRMQITKTTTKIIFSKCSLVNLFHEGRRTHACLSKRVPAGFFIPARRAL